jgi:hypothetical protein
MIILLLLGVGSIAVIVVPSEQTRHRVVRQVYSVGALIHENRYWRIACGIGDGLGQLRHACI